MAIWQFDCNIIPRIYKSTKLYNIDITSWIGVDLKQEPIQYLKQNFELQQSWCKDIIQFGKDDETCIKFIKENEKVDEIICRLDLRTLKRKDLQLIITFINDIKADLYYLDKVYTATMPVWVDLINESAASKYCKNPVTFLKNLV